MRSKRRTHPRNVKFQHRPHNPKYHRSSNPPALDTTHFNTVIIRGLSQDLFPPPPPPISLLDIKSLDGESTPRTTLTWDNSYHNITMQFHNTQETEEYFTGLQAGHKREHATHVSWQYINSSFLPKTSKARILCAGGPSRGRQGADQGLRYQTSSRLGIGRGVASPERGSLVRSDTTRY